MQGPIVPFERFGHCTVSLNAKHVLVVGGFSNQHEFEPSFMEFNSSKSKWTKISALNELPCQGPPVGFQTSCALVFYYFTNYFWLRAAKCIPSRDENCCRCCFCGWGGDKAKISMATKVYKL